MGRTGVRAAAISRELPVDPEKTPRSIVSVQASIPEDAFTAPVLRYRAHGQLHGYPGKRVVLAIATQNGSRQDLADTQTSFRSARRKATEPFPACIIIVNC